ncbi:MAG: MetQ/NlpA family ABC transporter substrate-binding protein [Leucobacter sp.]
MKLKRFGVLTASVAVAALALSGCSASGGADDAVKIGVVGASDPYWETFTEAAAEEGITVELVDFADYNQPNPALSEGELDLNQFQHIVYLADYNVASGDDLEPLGSTAIYPLAVFSEKYDDVSEIPEGGEIAIPNDESNRARALLVLQQAGLLELEGGGNIFSTPDDIIADSSKVTVTEVDASFTASSIQDVDAAVVNNDFVTKAGLNFADAIFQDDPEDENALPYVNIFAVRAEDRDNETYLKLVEIYQTNDAVQAGVLENSGGSAVLLQTPVSELVASLERVQEDIKSNG